MPVATKNKPLGLTALATMVLLGCSKSALYRRINAGSLPVMPMPGDLRISVAGLERVVGRELTADEILSAEESAVEIRAAMLAAKHARAAKQSTKRETAP